MQAPREIILRPALVAALTLGASAALAVPSSAESMRGGFTREDGMNAVRYAGDTWTIHDLIARRELAPARFDLHHERLGYGLRMGLDGLQARRDLNPTRFDFYHPFLGYLVADADGDLPAQGIDTLGQPDLPPDTVLGEGPSAPGPQGPLGPPGVVPPEMPGPDTPGPPPIPVEGPTPPLPPTSSQEPTPPGVAPPTPPAPPPPTSSAAIPEPSGLLLWALGVIGVAGTMAWGRIRRPRPCRLGQA